MRSSSASSSQSGTARRPFQPQQQGQGPSRKNSNASNASSTSAAASAANASTAQPSSSSSLPPIPLSDLLGTHIQLTLNVGNRDKERPIVSGQLCCYDQTYGALALAGPNASYRIVRLSSIQAIQVLPSPQGQAHGQAQGQASVDIETKPVSIDKLREREAAGVANEQKRLAREPPPGVSELGKELFDALGKTLPVRWAQTTIVVMDEVLVEAPYDPSPAHGNVKSNNQQRKERVIKVLQGERSKLEKAKPHLFGQQ